MMKTLTILLAVFVVTTTSAPHFDPMSDELIHYINKVANTTWKAGHNFRPEDYESIKKTLTLDMEANKAYSRRYGKHLNKRLTEVILPINFDPREKWTNCPSLNEIRNQGDCGSCWAVGSVAAMSDRICIAGGGNISLSAEQLISCYVKDGCNGGFIMSAYDYWIVNGIVTGGAYDSNQGCYPYEIPPCGAPLKPCGNKTLHAPSCKTECRPGYRTKYQEDKHFAKQVYQIGHISTMMEELVMYGPFTAAFNVYEDFMSYKSGVYTHKTGALLGGHAVKIIGYGIENGVDYWLVANSWGTGWGDKGFFKILKGDDECQIESTSVEGGIPKI